MQTILAPSAGDSSLVCTRCSSYWMRPCCGGLRRAVDVKCFPTIGPSRSEDSWMRLNIVSIVLLQRRKVLKYREASWHLVAIWGNPTEDQERSKTLWETAGANDNKELWDSSSKSGCNTNTSVYLLTKWKQDGVFIKALKFFEVMKNCS